MHKFVKENFFTKDLLYKLKNNNNLTSEWRCGSSVPIGEFMTLSSSVFT